MKTQSLATIVDLQKSIRRGETDADTTMHLIAERAQEIANASGVAIGRLRGDQLVYAAGSGSAAPYIGRRVMAIFSTSRNIESKAEILRVENSTHDDRIEAAVCRQFGVQSLLMLPIFCGRRMAGVLQVLFDEPHVFQDQEVRTYRIMAGLVGEAMALAVAAEISHLMPMATAEPVAVQRAAKILEAPIRPLEPARSAEVAQRAEEVQAIQPVVVRSVSLLSYAVEAKRVGLAQLRVVQARLRVLRAQYHVPQARWREWREQFQRGLEQVRLSTLSFWQQAKHMPAYKRSRISGLVAASIVGTFAWMMFADRPAISSSLPKAAQETSDSSAQAAEVPTQAPHVETSPAKSTRPTARRKTNRSYASTTSTEDSQYPGVKHFGNDVTVRYFTSQPVVLKTKPKHRVRQVSDDVTVRYFGPLDSGPQPALENGRQSSLNR